MTLCDLHPWNFPGNSMVWVAISFSGDLTDPGIESRFSALQADALLSEPPGKPATRKAPFLKNLPAMQETQIRSRVRKIP